MFQAPIGVAIAKIQNPQVTFDISTSIAPPPTPIMPKIVCLFVVVLRPSNI